MRRTLRIPVPWGHQPHSPPDDPFAELIAVSLGAELNSVTGLPWLERCRCLADFAWPARRPPVACPLGQRGDCAWGVQDSEANFCMWVWVRQHPDGAKALPEMARALGQSKERINSVCKQLTDKVRLVAERMSLPQLY